MLLCVCADSGSLSLRVNAVMFGPHRHVRRLAKSPLGRHWQGHPARARAVATGTSSCSGALSTSLNLAFVCELLHRLGAECVALRVWLAARLVDAVP